MVDYVKGKIGKEDCSFGTGSFNRFDSGGNAVSRTQLNERFFPRNVEEKTADFTIDANSYGGSTIFTNDGATATIAGTLPRAIIGAGRYTFKVIDAYAFDVVPNGTDLFRDCEASKKKTIDGIAGNELTVWCDVTGTWEFDYKLVSGVITDEA